MKQLQDADVAFELLEYSHDPRTESYGMEAAQALGVEPESVYKTLVAQTDDGRLVVAIVPVNATLNLKALARAAGSKRAAMADAALAQRSSGYVLGGISPFGQKKRLATLLDSSALTQRAILVSGGRRGLEISIAPSDLLQVLNGRDAAIATR